MSYKKLITECLLKLCVACKVSFFELLFFRSNRLRKGFAIDFGLLQLYTLCKTVIVELPPLQHISLQTAKL
jgi:hypothetical protein